MRELLKQEEVNVTKKVLPHQSSVNILPVQQWGKEALQHQTELMGGWQLEQ